MTLPNLNDYNIWNIKQNRFIPDDEKEDVLISLGGEEALDKEYPSLLDEEVGQFLTTNIPQGGKKPYYPIRDDYNEIYDTINERLPYSMLIKNIFKVFDPVVLTFKTNFVHFWTRTQDSKNTIFFTEVFTGDVVKIGGNFYRLRKIGNTLDFKNISNLDFFMSNQVIELIRHIREMDGVLQFLVPANLQGRFIEKVGTIFDEPYFGDMFRKLALSNWNDMIQEYNPNDTPQT